MQITDSDLKLSKSRHNFKQNQTATNMYISLQTSLACPIKTTMQMHTDSHNTDGPALCYHLLWQHTGTVKSVIHDQQLCLNNLSTKLGNL
eukprot:584717-Ditylum_brightwellii.AAC.1